MVVHFYMCFVVCSLGNRPARVNLMFVARTDCIFLTPPLQCHRRLRTQLTLGRGTVTNAGRQFAGTLAVVMGSRGIQPGWVLVSRVAYVQVRAPTGGGYDS